MRTTILPEDKTVIVNGTALVLPEFPPLAANIHAIQFYPDSGYATVERKIGEREHIAGEAAAHLVKPFVDAHAAHTAVAQVMARAAADKRTTDEKEIAGRHAKIRDDLKAAADVAAAAEAKRQEREASRAAVPTGNATSSGTQAI